MLPVVLPQVMALSGEHRPDCLYHLGEWSVAEKLGDARGGGPQSGLYHVYSDSGSTFPKQDGWHSNASCSQRWETESGGLEGFPFHNPAGEATRSPPS